MILHRRQMSEVRRLGARTVYLHTTCREQVNQRRKMATAQFGLHCSEDHPDENCAEPGNVRWLRARKRDVITREAYVASIVQREKGGQKEGSCRASDRFFRFCYIDGVTGTWITGLIIFRLGSRVLWEMVSVRAGPLSVQILRIASRETLRNYINSWPNHVYNIPSRAELHNGGPGRLSFPTAPPEVTLPGKAPRRPTPSLDPHDRR